MSHAELVSLPPDTWVYLHDGVRVSRRAKLKVIGKIKSRVVTERGKEILVANARLKPHFNF